MTPEEQRFRSELVGLLPRLRIHGVFRDEKVALFATNLPAGTYEYTYQIRAGLDGVYNVLPAHAEEMYFPEVFGRGDGGLFRVTE